MSRQGFVKAFKRIHDGRSSYERFFDFVTIFALEMASTVNVIPAQLNSRRDASAAKYDGSASRAMCEMMAEFVSTYEDEPDQDMLGSAYMELGIGNKDTGQFFTPYSLCAAIASSQVENVKTKLEEQEYVAANDPACGGGAMLIAFANIMRKAGIDYQRRIWVEGTDINLETALMCYMQLSIIGCAGAVTIGDALNGEQGTRLYTPMVAMEPGWFLRIERW